MRILTILGLALFASLPAAAATGATDPAAAVALEGVGLGAIKLGQSTLADVKDAFGAGYELERYGDYSQALAYPELGLAFYSCQKDSRDQVFAIDVRRPGARVSSKGLVVGQSSIADMIQAFGEAEPYTADTRVWTFEYSGITFDFRYDKPSETASLPDDLKRHAIVSALVTATGREYDPCDAYAAAAQP